MTTAAATTAAVTLTAATAVAEPSGAGGNGLPDTLHPVTRSALVWILLLAAPSARAEPGPASPPRPPALWSSNLPARDAAPLRAAIEASSGLDLLDPATARDRLRALARTLATDPQSRASEEALRSAREAYVVLRLDDARAAYGRALEATLASARPAADAAAVAKIVFERALVALAAQKRTDARRDLLAAVAIDPGLVPSQDVYGPPVFRALDEARTTLARAPAARVDVDRVPADAVVRVDGVVLPAGAAASVRAGVSHLVVAERPGYVPRALWLDAPPRTGTRLAIVLPEATGALLSAQALTAWVGPGAPIGETGALVARALGIGHVVEAARDGAGSIRLVRRDARTGALVRSAEGGLVPWEPRPYHVLAEALEGRVVEPPVRAASASLAASVPTEVPPAQTFALRLTLRDPTARVRALEARCGRAAARVRIAPTATGTFTLPVRAPEREGTVACLLRGIDAAGRVVVSLPAAGERLSLRIAERPGRPSLVGRWWFWGAIGAVAAGGVIATVVATRDEPSPRQFLVMHAP